MLADSVAFDIRIWAMLIFPKRLNLNKKAYFGTSSQRKLLLFFAKTIIKIVENDKNPTLCIQST